MKDTQKTLMSVKNLSTSFVSKNGNIPAISNVSFDIAPRKSIALVGESGCGKSVTALSILRLLSEPPARITADYVKFGDIDMMKLGQAELRKMRGKDISMIFQEPMTSLNPLLTVGFQIAEPVQVHLHMKKKEAFEYAVDMLNAVGIPDARKRATEYPHQMSGGMRQRVMIALALSCNPQLLIADEPTTALDVTIQSQILDLIAKLQHERNMSMLLITHNLGVVAEVADEVIVMYAGQIIETMPVNTVFSHPWHPYTHGLLRSIPSVERKVKELNVIPGVVPSPLFFSKYCRFAPRCKYATERCRQESPQLVEVEPGHQVRCFCPLSDERGMIND